MSGPRSKVALDSGRSIIETGCGSTPLPDTAKALAGQGQPPLHWPLAQTPLQPCPSIGISPMPVSAERQRELRRMRTECRNADWQAAGYTARANAVARKSRAGRKATAAARLPRLAPITLVPEHQRDQPARHPRWPRAVAQVETHSGRNAWPRSHSRSPSGRSARREASSLPDA